ncbi:MAG: hypothetical protein ACLQVD_14960 [Capsulimonadaceae bacterium]
MNNNPDLRRGRSGRVLAWLFAVFPLAALPAACVPQPHMSPAILTKQSKQVATGTIPSTR